MGMNMISREERLRKLRAEAQKDKPGAGSASSGNNGVASDKATALIAEALKSMLRS